MGSTKAGQREHYWDAIRATLMLLGIPYHTALAYRPGRDWIVFSGEGAPVFTYLAESLHVFRMPAFFVVAGYFAGRLLASRAPFAWLRSRYTRLGVPLVTCLLTLVPLLNLACEVSNHPLPQALASWRHSTATSGGYWVRHLWFIIVLLYCSTAAAWIAWRWPSMRTALLPARLDAWIARRFLLALAVAAAAVGLWEAIAIELFYMAGLATNVPQQILRIDELLAYSPYFALGCLLSRAPLALARLGRFSPAVAATAAAALTTSLVLMDELAPPVGRFVATTGALAMTQVVIALARRLANRPRPAVQQLVSASFVIYLFHMPVIILLVNVGQYVAMPVAVKASLVMVLALVISFGAWQAISRSSWLGFLFNGSPAPTKLRAALA